MSEDRRGDGDEVLAGDAAPAIDRSGLEVLSAWECRRLLERHLPRIGRVGLVADGRPLVLPVNYAWEDDSVVIRTHPGSAHSVELPTLWDAARRSEVDGGAGRRKGLFRCCRGSRPATTT